LVAATGGRKRIQWSIREDSFMDPTPTHGWKYYLGIGLFVFSCATFGFAALAPLIFSPAIAATVATGVVISGEIGFWVAAALLGKPFVEGLKAKLKGWFHRPTAPRPLSRQRHTVGIVLFTFRLLVYYVIIAIPFCGLERSTELTLIVAVALSGEAAFFSSLLILGGDFWAKLKALYEWPGADAPGP